MSPEERRKQIAGIWDSPSDADRGEIPDDHREVADRRFAIADADPMAGTPWDEVPVRLTCVRPSQNPN
jgi:hypothetical protein